MKPSDKIYNLSIAAHKRHIPRHQFLASLHPEERFEAAKSYDEVETLAELPSLPNDREIIHHKLTINTRKLNPVSSREVGPDELVFLAGLLRTEGGVITAANTAEQRNLPSSGGLIELEILRPAKNWATFEFRSGGYALTIASWAADPSATPYAWGWIEKLWLNLGDVSPGAVDAVRNQSMPEPPTSPWTATILMPPLSSHSLHVAQYLSRLTAALGVLLQHQFGLQTTAD